MKTLIKILPITSMLFPMIASAQEFNKTKTLLVEIGNLLDMGILIAAGIALLAFFWGLAKFIYKAGDEKNHAEGKNIMKRGLISLFLIISVWGIVRFIQGELLPGADFSNPLQVPGFGEPW